MPSGSKKRKAARRTKKQAPSANSSGIDEPRSQDERESEGGHSSSYVSQDEHNPLHTFSWGGDEWKRSQSRVVTKENSAEEASKDNKSTKKSGTGTVDVKIKKGCEPKSDLESTRVSIKHGKCSSSSSSSSSSDDETQAFKKSKGKARNIGSEVASYNTENKSSTVLGEEAPKVAENVAFDNGDNKKSAGDTVAVNNSVKSALSLTSENNSVHDLVESGLNANEEKSFPSSSRISGVEFEGAEGKDFPSSDIPTSESSNIAETNQTLDSHEYSEKQPLVASTPPPVKRTSCLGCCGLFEVFTGSGR